MEAIKDANLALRFILELCALAALGYWGFTTGTDTGMRWLLGIGAPLLAAVIWALFVAPKATIEVPDALRIALQVLVFGSAAALFATGLRTLAIVFIAVVILNAILMVVWNQ